MTGEMPAATTVTVLLPVYNAGSFLGPAVDSVLAQTHADFELLIVDDGSTDGSSEALDGLEDSRVRVLHQANTGLVGALNAGLSATSSEFVARMDQDDLSHPARLERQLDYLVQHPAVAAVGCCYEVMDEAGTMTAVAHVAGQPEYLRRQLYFRNIFPHGGMVFRRSAVMSVGGYREVGPAEDYDLWVRLAQRYELANVPDVLYRYRLTGTGMSLQSAEHQRETMRGIRHRLHLERPLSVSSRQIFRDGRSHHQAFVATCAAPLRNYVYDHAWLALLLARRGRWRVALSSAAGAAALLMRHPLACVSGLTWRP